MISKKSLLGVLAPVLLMTLIASCGGGGGGNAPETPVATPSPAPAPKGLLVQIAGSDELREKAVQGLQNYFEERLRSSTESSDLEGIATLESDSGDGSGDSGTAADAGMRTETISFTTTYTL